MEDTLQQNNNAQTDDNQSSAPTNVEGTAAPSDKDRTGEQFNKLKESNSELNQRNLDLQRQLESARNPQKEAPAPTPVVPNNIDLSSYVEIDPKTGERFINETKLTTAIKDLQDKTTNAERTIQGYIKTSEERRIEAEQEKAFSAHPDLKPGSDKFDKTFYKTVRSVLYDSMMNADEYGKTLSLKEAADYVRQELIKNPSVTTEELEKKNKGTDAKAQAGTMVPSQPQNAPAPAMSEDLNRLRLATRRGSTEALAQRILNTDHVIKES
jgi:hypothetical protein